MFLFLSGLCVASLSFYYAQYGGAIYNSDGGALTFKGSATFTSCLVEVSSSSSSHYYYDDFFSSSAYAVSSDEWLPVEEVRPSL